ncbi:MAG: hypothetical protein M1833_001198 [Piccolia ochrophora]|nr:MAG: hypothetical protein M1833_001198 [Piccolia ochrophora]
MSGRGNEGHMDFEWQTAGPADHTSPFYQLSVRHKQRQQEEMAKKRSHSVLDSPIKATAPTLTEPASQTYLFSQTPSQAFRNPSFTTPRKFDTPDMASSPPDLPSSPDNADAEDTPDNTSRGHWAGKDNARSLAQFTANPKSEKKQPIFGVFGKFNSPGRGEVRRGNYSNAIVRRVQKRRRHDTDKDSRLTSRRSSYETDSDDPRSGDAGGVSASYGRPPSTAAGVLPSLFTFLETHPALPHVLSFYAQLLLNLFLVFFFVYLIYSFWSTIRQDVDEASEKAAAETLAEMAACAQQFVDNRCDRSSRVPAMESVCNNWEKCMNKDPNSVGRARVSAHTFAEIFNSFIEPISYKAMIFSLTLVFGCVAISNFAFGFFRTKAHPPPSVPPPTPYASHPYPGAEHYYTPYGSQAHLHSPGPSMLAQTPSRRRLGYH